MASTRRAFLKGAAMLTASGALGVNPWSAIKAFAGAADYKALVCIHLAGGNDASNMIVPYDAGGYANYASLRGSLAIAQNKLLPLTPTPGFALHPSMPEMQALYNSGNLALLNNVGPLNKPTTRAEVLSGNASLPINLYSHSDQINCWHDVINGDTGATGWGGRVADLLSSQYNSGAKIPMFVSVNGITAMGAGAATRYLSLTTDTLNGVACHEGAQCSGRLQAAQQLAALSSGNSLVQADNMITTDAYNYMSNITSALASASALNTVFPASALGAQLKLIARLMQSRSNFGGQRQIFFATLGGFDTHAADLTGQAALLTQLSQALQAFYAALVELGLQNNVTTFTVSEFGRALQGNSDAGCDHGWGGHQLILGGAVKGGSMYGVYPTLAYGGADDSGSNGRWIPTTAVTQYAATLAKWFGVSSGQLATIFPSLSRFSSSDLGFL